MTTASSTKPGISRDQALLAMFRRHTEIEGAALDAYREVAESSDAGEGVQYLVRMILDDEERHHRLFEEMANEVRSVLWEVPVEPRAPTISRSTDPELLEATKQLLAMEKADLKELRSLKKTLRDSPRNSLQPVLVEVMLHDTQKHIAILKAIVASLKR